MRRPAIIGFIVVLASILVAQSDQPEAAYKALVERVKAGDQTVDFKQLRLAYSDIPHATGTDPQKKAMFAALKSENFAEAVRTAELVLAADYVDMDAHIAEAIANKELNKPDEAAFHRSVYEQLVKSILDSGDGTTPKTAWMVIQVHEEYVVLKALGIATLPLSQSLMKSEGHSYDRLVVDDPETQGKKTFYFNVDIPIKHGE